MSTTAQRAVAPPSSAERGPTVKARRRTPAAPSGLRAARPGPAAAGDSRRAASRDFAGVPPVAASAAPTGAGEPLDPTLRRQMEWSMRSDFSHVRVHRGTDAARVTAAAHAAAVTIGRAIFLAPGRGAADAPGGRAVLAHELAHVVQQRPGMPAPPIDRGAAHEREASSVARDAVAGRQAQVGARTGVGVARMTREEAEKLLTAGKAQWAAEPDHKKGPGAVAEGAALAQRGLAGDPAMNANLLAKNPTGAPTTEAIDLIARSGLSQVKTHEPRPSASGTGTSNKHLDRYATDFGALTESNVGYRAVGARKKAEKFAERMLAAESQIKAKGAWPQVRGKDLKADRRAIVGHVARRSFLDVPSDHLDAVVAHLAKKMEEKPEEYGLRDGPNLKRRIAQQLKRIRSSGLTYDSMAKISSDLYAGRTTKVEDLKETLPAPVPVPAPPKAGAKAPAPPKSGKTPPSGPTAGTESAEATVEAGVTTEPKAKPASKPKAKPASKPKASVKPTASPAPLKPKPAATTAPAAGSHPAAKPQAHPAPAPQPASTPTSAPKPVPMPEDHHELETKLRQKSKGSLPPSPSPGPPKSSPDAAHGPPLATTQKAAPAAKPPSPATATAVAKPPSVATPAPATKAQPMAAAPEARRPPTPRRPTPPKAPAPRPTAPKMPSASQVPDHPPDASHTPAGGSLDSQRSGALELDNQHGAAVGGTTALGSSLTTNGVKLGAHTDVSGHFRANVTAVPGHPDMVRISTTIDLTGGVTLSAGREVGHGGIGGSLGTSRTHVFTRSHDLTGPEAKQYLDAMHNGGEGGTFDEFRLLRAGLSENWDSAAALSRGMTADPAKGESTEASDSTTTSASLGGEANLGLLSLNANAGKSVTDEVVVDIGNPTGGVFDISVKVNRIEATTAGGGLKVAQVGGGVGFEQQFSAGSVYHFGVPTSDDAAKETIRRARTLAELAHLAGAYPAYYHGLSTLTGMGRGSKVDLSLGPLAVNMGGSGTSQQEVDHDAQGNPTGSSVESQNTTGGSLNLYGFGFGDSESEKFKATTQTGAAANGRQLAVGEIGHSTSKSMSLPWLKKTTTTDSRTSYYTNAAFDRIVAEAHSNGWRTHIPIGPNADDWAALGRKLRALSHWASDERGGRWDYDATLVEGAIGEFNAGDTGGRLGGVENIIRGTGGGGDLATQGSFPPALVGYEADFKQFVVVDPVGNSKLLREIDKLQNELVQPGGDPAPLVELAHQAVEEMTVARTHLAALHDGLDGRDQEFTEKAVFAKMMAVIAQRQTAVGNELKALAEIITPHARVGQPLPEADTGDRAAPSELKTGAPLPPDPERRAEAEAKAKENVAQMWRYNTGLWGSVGLAERLTSDGLTDNLQKINQALDDALSAIHDWRERRKWNLNAIAEFGLNATYDGPGLDYWDARYDAARKAASRDH